MLSSSTRRTSTSRVRGPLRTVRTLPAEVSRRLGRVEQLAGGEVSLESDDAVQEAALTLGPAERSRLVYGRDGEVGVEVAELAHRGREMAQAIAQVGAETEKRLHAQPAPAPPRSRRRRTPAEARSAGTGGRSLRTVTVTAATSGISSTPSAIAPASASSSLNRRSADDRPGRLDDERVVDRPARARRRVPPRRAPPRRRDRPRTAAPCPAHPRGPRDARAPAARAARSGRSSMSGRRHLLAGERVGRRALYPPASHRSPILRSAGAGGVVSATTIAARSSSSIVAPIAVSPTCAISSATPAPLGNASSERGEARERGHLFHDGDDRAPYRAHLAREQLLQAVMARGPSGRISLQSR